MTSSFGRQTIAAGPNVFPDPYEKYYNKKDREFAQLVARVANQGKEEVARANQEKLSTIIEPLGPLSKSLGTLVAQRKAAAAKAELRDNKELELKINNLIAGNPETHENFKSLIPKWNKDVKVVEDELSNLLKTYKQEKINGEANPYFALTKDPNLLAFFQDTSAAELIRTHKILGHQSTRNAPNTFTQGIHSTNGALQIAYEPIKNDPEKVRALYVEHAVDGLKQLGYDLPFIAANYLGDIKKAANSKAITASLETKQIALTKAEAKFGDELTILATKSLNTVDGDPNAITTRVQRRILDLVNPAEGIDIDKARDMVGGTVDRLIKANKFSQEALGALRNGLAKHASGKKYDPKTMRLGQYVNEEFVPLEDINPNDKYSTGDILFGKEWWADKQRAIDWRDTSLLNARKDVVASNLDTAVAGWIESGDEKGYINALNAATQILGEDHPKVKWALNLNIDEQSAAYYNANESSWNEQLRNGGFHFKSEKDLELAIPNTTARKYYKKEIVAEKDALNQLNYKQNDWDSVIADHSGLIKHWKQGDALQGTGGQVSSHLEKYRLDLTLTEIRDNRVRNGGVYKHDSGIMTRVNVAVDQYWKTNDGGKVGSQYKGIFALDSENGNYKNFVQKQLKANAQLIKNHKTPATPAEKEQAWSRIVIIDEQGQPDIKAMMAKPNGIFSKNHMRGTLETKQFSDEMYHIAKQSNVSIIKLWEAAIESLNNSDSEADRDFAKRWNLDKGDKIKGDFEDWNVNAEKVLEEHLEGISKKFKGEDLDSRELRDYTRRLSLRGWNRLRPSEKAVIYKLLQQKR